MSSQNNTPQSNGIQDIYVSKPAQEAGGKALLDSNSQFISELFQRCPCNINDISQSANQSVLVEVFRETCIQDSIARFLAIIFPFEPAMLLIRGGLIQMKANEYIDPFDRIVGLAQQVGPDSFKSGRHELSAATKASLSQLEDELAVLEQKHSLLDYNTVWLNNHPKLHILEQTEWSDTLDRLAAILSAKQKEKRGENLSRETRIAIALCELANMEFEAITTMEPRLSIHGQSLLGFNFTTHEGAFLFYEKDGEAIMHEQGGLRPVCRLVLNEDF